MWDYQNQIPGESYQIMKEEKKCVSCNVNGLFAQSYSSWLEFFLECD